jgi:hypothetical protein
MVAPKATRWAIPPHLQALSDLVPMTAR